MIQCETCEYYSCTPDGEVVLRCDPYSTIREPACLQKWQLYKLTKLTRAYQATVEIYERLAPLQEKMMRHMEREIDEVEEADKWKYGSDEDDD
jgi:hypothetical protein